MGEEGGGLGGRTGGIGEELGLRSKSGDEWGDKSQLRLVSHI